MLTIYSDSEGYPNQSNLTEKSLPNLSQNPTYWEFLENNLAANVFASFKSKKKLQVKKANHPINNLIFPQSVV